MALGAGCRNLHYLPDPQHVTNSRADSDNRALHPGIDSFAGSDSAARFFVTKAEEQNMWSRLVMLEKIVAKLMEKNTTLPVEPVVDPHAAEPPRDHYGAAVGRPNM
jgi:hypothetical protein